MLVLAGDQRCVHHSTRRCALLRLHQNCLRRWCSDAERPGEFRSVQNLIGRAKTFARRARGITRTRSAALARVV
jgi:hypothetical protein